MVHTQPPVLQQPRLDGVVDPNHHLVPCLEILRLRGLALQQNRGRLSKIRAGSGAQIDWISC